MVVKLYNPHQNQQLIHDSINNEYYKYYCLNIGRQFGKSLLGINQALYWLFNYKNAKIGWVSPVYKQCKKVFKDIDIAFADNQNIFKEKNKTDLFFISHTNTSINFYSSESYDSIRGETFDFLILDEFAFQHEKAWSEVLRATVLVRGKKVLFLSTPKGKNHFYKLHSLDGINEQYKSFTMTSYHNPLIEKSEIDDARLTLPDHVFRQEYLAEFIDGGAGVFRNVVINDSPKQTARYYAGVDLGRADDYTVITVFNDIGQMVLIERFRHDTWSNISIKVAEIINRYSAYTLIESNSIGDAICEQVKTLCTNKSDIVPFVTTSKSKQDIIEQMAVAIQNKEMTVLSVDWYLKELDIFGYEYNPKTKSVRYSAPSGFHDDGVMSSAIGYQSLKSLAKSGRYTIM